MAKKTVLTLALSQKEADRLYQAWQQFSNASLPPYADWQVRPENCVITHYRTGKVVFQGTDAQLYAAPFQTQEQKLPQAGSDEVGTGDYFGPVCVCACIVEPQDMQLIRDLGVRDSKALNDSDIRTCAPQLMKQLRYSLLIVSDEKYNAVHGTANMNAVKALLHNQAYINLSRKTKLPEFRIIDQFAPEPIYYHYLKNEKTVIRGIHFETKAENKYPAVGAASIIARYAFLISMDKMEKQYGMAFQKGAGVHADEDAMAFVAKYGRERLKEVAKLHFKNTARLSEIENKAG